VIYSFTTQIRISASFISLVLYLLIESLVFLSAFLVSRRRLGEEDMDPAQSTARAASVNNRDLFFLWPWKHL